MTAITMKPDLLDRLMSVLVPGRPARAATPPRHDAAAAARRDVLLDAMRTNPEAIQGEYGLQAMMSLHPGDF